jgi:hypothetical protein
MGQNGGGNWMVRFFGLLLLTLTVIQTSSADNSYWNQVTVTTLLESGLSDIRTYDEGMEFFYFPSFRPIELYRLYRVNDKWYALHSVFRRISGAELFDTDKLRGHLEVQTRVVSLGTVQLGLILRQLRENSFYEFKGDESEKKGFDGETFYFQILKDREQVSFSYWNVGSSTKSIRMNAIVKAFRDVDYERD